MRSSVSDRDGKRALVVEVEKRAGVARLFGLRHMGEAAKAVVELVHYGPNRQQAQGVLDMVFDPKRCRVVLVTLPEDMPVRETAESVETLTKMGIALGPLVVNGVYPKMFPSSSLKSL